MGAMVQRVLFIFDAAACAAVWSLVVVAAFRGGAAPGLGWGAILGPTLVFAAGFLVGGVAGAVALRRLAPERLTRALYGVVGGFVVGMIVLKVLGRMGLSAF